MKAIHFIGRAFATLWRGIDILRRSLLNILFVLILIAVLIALLAPEPPAPKSAALVIRPHGALLEQAESSDTFSLLLADNQAPTHSLHEYIDAIDRATTDPHISGLIVRTSDLAPSGLAALTELRQAILRFRQSGKPVLAWAGHYSQSQYWLASAADEVTLAPDGLVLLTGLARYSPYFGDALQKLGIKVHVFRVGEYKSFAEPFTRADMSDEDRASTQDLLHGLWHEIQPALEQQRQLNAGQLDHYLHNYPTALQQANGNPAAAAVANALVDELLTHDQWQDKLRAQFGQTANGQPRTISLGRYLGQRPSTPAAGAGQIAAIVVQGAIVDGNSGNNTAGGETIARQIRQAREDDNIKALLIRIDSPGGSAFASERIRRELEITREAGKPVIASMGATAASGGYWIASGADEIWAQPATITGSIGIFALLPEFTAAANEMGIHQDGVATAPLAGQPDPFRPLAPQTAQAMQSTLDHGYRRFLQIVATARNSTPEKIDHVARGRVWTGRTAHKLGLVDQLGDLPQALAATAQRAGLPDSAAAHPRWIGPRIPLARQLLRQFSKMTGLHQATLPARQGAAASQLLQQMQAPLAAFLQLNDPQHLYAHCFCQLP